MIMNQFGIFDESQLASGNMIDLDNFQRRRNGKRFDVRSHVTEAVLALKQKFRRCALLLGLLLLPFSWG